MQVIIGKRRLVQKSEEPKGYLVALANLRIIACIDDVGRVAHLVAGIGITDAELEFSVDQIEGVVSALIDFMVFPHRVDEERLHSRLLLYVNGVDGIEQVGVVEHHLRRLLGEVFA